MTHPMDGTTWLHRPCCLPSQAGSGVECIRMKERREMGLSGKREALAMTGEGECAGKSLIEMLEDRLDEQFDQLMSPAGLEEPELAKGIAQGLSIALAIMTNPYFPNVNAVKAAAVERYETRTAEEAEQYPEDV